MRILESICWMEMVYDLEGNPNTDLYLFIFKLSLFLPTMKLNLLLILAFSLLNLAGLKAQNCLSHEMMLRQLAENPAFQQGMDQLEAETQAYIKAHRHDKSTQSTKVIPVVFHVIHNGGNENISVAQIKNQVEILNAEFKRMFADTVKTPVPFKPLAGTIDVEFRLASKDPNGNCTQGITRTYHPFSVCSANEEDVKALQYWPNNKYLNVWLVSSMHYSGQTSCSGGGYAQFPGINANQLTDGINIRADLIGSIGTATTNTGWGNFQGRYLIHELGHWFNMRHIWGDQTCGNDLVDDTPVHQGANSGCPAFPWRPNNTCGSDANGEMYTNYMDYTNGPCLNMFSKGQALRAEAAMNSSASGRNNLWTPANLTATGTEAALFPNCPAVPEMFPYIPKIICDNGTHSIRDASYGGTKTSRQWSTPGGQASSLTDSLITITYSQPGVYSIGLANTNPQGTVSKTFHDRVVVLDNGPAVNAGIPYVESFEGSGMPNGWYLMNSGADTTWRVTSDLGYESNQSLRLRNFSNPIGGIDELISPRFDLSNTSAGSLKFKLAYSARNNSNKDRLVIAISVNCGQTWTTVYNKMANNSSANSELKTNPNTTVNFLPFNPDQWREETINIAANLRTNNVRFRITFTGSGGNNIYIDDFRIDGTSIVSNLELNELPEIDLVPNPSHEKIRLMGIDEPFVFKLLDIQGRELRTEILEPERSLDIQSLSPGLYIWRAETRRGVVSGRLVKD